MHAYIHVNKYMHISGGGSLLNQVGLFYWKENICMAKVKILWSILKMRWDCSPIAPPFPLPMMHMYVQYYFRTPFLLNYACL